MDDTEYVRTSHDEGRVCLCVKTHSPEPEELARHRILPGEFGGTYAEENVAWLCPTAHVNLHERLRSLMATGTQAPYGNRYVRALALKAYDLIEEVN